MFSIVNNNSHVMMGCKTVLGTDTSISSVNFDWTPSQVASTTLYSEKKEEIRKPDEETLLIKLLFLLDIESSYQRSQGIFT